MYYSAFFEKNVDLVNWVKEQVNVLPKEMSFVDAAIDEGKICKKNIVSNKKDLDKFFYDNKQGFFLYNKEDRELYADIEFSQANSFASVTIFYERPFNDLLEKNSNKLLDTFIAKNAYYVHGGTFEEYYSKNKVKIELNGSSVETWIGRNLNKYLPGVFWVNFISHVYAKNINLDVEKLAILFGVEIIRRRNGYLFKTAESANNWVSVEETHEKTKKFKQVFSRLNIDLSGMDGLNQFEILDKLGEYD